MKHDIRVNLLHIALQAKRYKNEKKLIIQGTMPKNTTYISPIEQEQIARIMHWESMSPNHFIIFYGDTYFPKQLQHIPSPPLCLFCVGNINLLNQPQIAIVGGRCADQYSLQIAYHLANHLSLLGITITSGLAKGIDGSAAYGAIQNAGSTIAVLGSGPDIVYPKQHNKLHKRITQNGLLVSEYPPGTKPHSYHFPQRNRIISGLSSGVCILSAKIKSGSMITARFALEHNRTVFSVPGPINQAAYAGCHYLIQEGAMLLQHTHDVFSEIPHLLAQAAQDQIAAHILYALREKPYTSKALHNIYPAYKLLPALKTLQRAGLIKQHGCSYQLSYQWPCFEFSA